jgi:hypothetical protein
LQTANFNMLIFPVLKKQLREIMEGLKVCTEY